LIYLDNGNDKIREDAVVVLQIGASHSPDQIMLADFFDGDLPSERNSGATLGATFVIETD